jgi:hypothetical protein
MSNIYSVIDEDHINEILTNNRFKIVSIAFVTDRSDVNKSIKKTFISLANELKSSFFIYINLDNYQSRGRFELEGVPTILIYFNMRRIGKISGGNIKDIKSCIYELEEQTRNIQPVHPPTVPSQQQPQMVPSHQQPPMVQTHQPPMVQTHQPPMVPSQQQPLMVQSQQQPPMVQTHQPPPMVQTQPPLQQMSHEDLVNIISKLEKVQEVKEKEEELLKK